MRKDILDCPRIQVQLDGSSKPRFTVELLNYNGRKHTQMIIYVSQPRYRSKCHIFGHFGDDCAGPETRARRPRYSAEKSGKRAPSREPRGNARLGSWPKNHHMEIPLGGNTNHAAGTQNGRKGDGTVGTQPNNIRILARVPNSNIATSPNMFDSLNGTNESNEEEERSYHSSDTEVVPVPQPKNNPPHVPLSSSPEVVVAEEEETDDWESRANPSTPLGVKKDGSPKPSSSSCSSDGSSAFSVNDSAPGPQKVTEQVVERGKGQPVETAQAKKSAQPDHPGQLVEAAQIAVHPPPVPPKVNTGGKPKLTSKEVAVQALKKLNKKPGQSPSKQKKKGNTPKKKKFK